MDCRFAGIACEAAPAAFFWNSHENIVCAYDFVGLRGVRRLAVRLFGIASPWRAGGRGGRRLQPLLLALVFVLVCWAFWQNTQRRLEDLSVQNSFSDETGTLDAGQKAMVRDYILAFRRETGLNLQVHVLLRPPVLAPSGGVIYLDILPRQRQLTLTLPPLVRRAVGESFVTDFEAAFAPYFQQEAWAQGLAPALRVLYAKLTEVTR